MKLYKDYDLSNLIVDILCFSLCCPCYSYEKCKEDPEKKLARQQAEAEANRAKVNEILKKAILAKQLQQSRQSSNVSMVGILSKQDESEEA